MTRNAPLRTSQTLIDLAHTLGRSFATRSAAYDQNYAFVKENYEALKSSGIFTALIPQELGGLGISHQDMGEFIRIIGSYDGSTALALSMHQHLVSANVWKYKQHKGGEEVLKKVVENQWVLISTGAKDWLDSNGSMQKTEGGYLVSATKFFASQSAYANILVTSACYEDLEQGPQVLHFSFPVSAEGVTILDDWYTLGMRGTGSNTVRFENVFVPDDAIALKRPKGLFHPLYNVIVTVAMPLIMAAYVGVAEHAANLIMKKAKKSDVHPGHFPYLLAEMNNQLTNAQIVWRDMLRITNNFDFKPVDKYGHEILTRKSLVANAVIATVQKAMEAMGGSAFYQKNGLEQLFRDVQGARYHPLPEKEQQVFSSNYLIRQTDSVDYD